MSENLPVKTVWHSNQEKPEHNRACVYVVNHPNNQFDFAGVSDFFGVSCFYFGDTPIYLKEVAKWCYVSEIP